MPGSRRRPGWPSGWEVGGVTGVALRAGRGAIPRALEGAVAGCAVVRVEGEAERTPKFGVWAPPRKELPCPETGPKGRGQSSAGCQSVNWMSGCLSRDAGSSGVQERVCGTMGVPRGLLLTFQATEWPEVTGSARGLRQERPKGLGFQPEVSPHLEPKQQLR